MDDPEFQGLWEGESDFGWSINQFLMGADLWKPGQERAACFTKMSARACKVQRLLNSEQSEKSTASL